MILSDRLWRSLQQPDPAWLYRKLTWRTAEQAARAEQVEAGLGCLLSFPLLIVVSVTGLLSFAVFVNALGVQQLVTVTTSLTRLMTTGRYDLLALTPDGRSWLHWLYARVHTEQNRVYRINLFDLIFMMGTFVNAFMLFLFTHTHFGGGSGLLALLVTLLLALFIGLHGVTLYVEWVQSLALASLIGMLAPTFTRNPALALTGGVTAFLSIQVGAYVGATLLVLWLYDQPAHPFLTPGVFVAALALLVVVREAIMLVLWRVLQRRLNVEAIAWLVPSAPRRKVAW